MGIRLFIIFSFLLFSRQVLCEDEVSIYLYEKSNISYFIDQSELVVIGSFRGLETREAQEINSNAKSYFTNLKFKISKVLKGGALEGEILEVGLPRKNIGYADTPLSVDELEEIYKEKQKQVSAALMSKYLYFEKIFNDGWISENTFLAIKNEYISLLNIMSQKEHVVRTRIARISEIYIPPRRITVYPENEYLLLLKYNEGDKFYPKYRFVPDEDYGIYEKLDIPYIESLIQKK